MLRMCRLDGFLDRWDWDMDARERVGLVRFGLVSFGAERMRVIGKRRWWRSRRMV